jgi:hypothetical protein
LSPPAREDRPGRPRALRCGSIRAAREGGDCSLVVCGREWKQLGSLICPRDARAPLQNGSCGTADQQSRPHPAGQRYSLLFLRLLRESLPGRARFAADPKRGDGTAVPSRAGAASRRLAALLAAVTLGSAQWARPSRVPLMPRTSRWRR